jgi:hypothetical protein
VLRFYFVHIVEQFQGGNKEPQNVTMATLLAHRVPIHPSIHPSICPLGISCGSGVGCFNPSCMAEAPIPSAPEISESTETGVSTF